MPTRTQQSDILLAAYASHGDTKHPLLFPATPKECFEMTADAFDLTEQLQTPVIVMTDLDLGMNDHVTEPLQWDDSRAYNRGKVLTADQLEQIGGVAGNLELETQTNGDQAPTQPLEQFRGKFGRYLDIDDDGIPYRTIPGTHPMKGAFVTRGSSRDEYAVYTEDGDVYRQNVDRLARKWNTAKELVPQPEFYGSAGSPPAGGGVAAASADGVVGAAKPGVIFFGTSTYSAEEAIELLKEENIELDAMRVRGFPFGKAFVDFVNSYERIFVIEQNRDAQFKSLMMIELGVDPAKLVSVLNYNGMPITADNILKQIKENLDRHP
jgi:2-oxoglutarate ferredoxin oxidoreductase subunit alpha